MGRARECRMSLEMASLAALAVLGVAASGCGNSQPQINQASTNQTSPTGGGGRRLFVTLRLSRVVFASRVLC